MDDRVKYARDFFIEKGWAPHQAAAIVGNFIAESGLDPNVIGDQGKAIGISQWNNRAPALLAYANEKGKDWRDFDLQLEFAQHELETTEHKAGVKLQQAKNVQEANDAVISFLRPQGSNKGAEYAMHYDKRLGYSEHIYQDYGGVLPTKEYLPPVEELFPARVGEIRHTFIRSPDAPTGAPEPFNPYAIPPSMGFLESIKNGLLYDNTLAHYAHGAWRGVLSYDWYDPNFKFKEGQLEELKSRYPEDYHPLIASATSQKWLDYALDNIDADLYRKRRYEASGKGATAGYFIGEAIPEALMLLPFGWAGRGLQGASFLTRVAGETAVNAGAEGLLSYGAKKMFNEPNAHPLEDAMGAGVGTAVFMGAHAGTFGLIKTLGRNSKTAPTAEHMLSAVQSEGNPKAPISTAESPTEFAHSRSAFMNINDEDVGKGFGGVLRQDITGQGTTSKVPQERMIMANLADETAGFTDFDVTPDSAATRKSALIRETRPKWRLSYDKSLEGYLNSFGFKGWNIQTKAEAAYEFSRNVMAELHNPNSSLNPHVKAAAGAIRPILEDLGAQLHEEGIIGDLIQGGYAPLIPDKRQVRWLHANVEEQSVVELLADAFQKRNPELPRDLALKGGKAYFTNLHPASYNLKRDMGMQFMEANKEDFIKAVQADSAYNGGVTREQAEQLYETMERVIGKTTKEKGNYRHAKRRSLLDYNHEGTIRLKNGQTMPLKVYDFFHQDAVAVMEQYTSSAAGRLALARTLIKNPQTGEIALNGIRNDADLERVKHWLSDAYKDYYRKESVDYTDKLNNALANIDFLYKRLLDIPLEGHDTWLAKALQRARTYNFIRLMSNMGLNQLPEVAKTITVLGATSILHPAHMVKSLVNLVSGNRVFANALTDEISEMTGLGLMHLRHSPHALGAALQTSKDVAATLGQKADHALGLGALITSHLSFMDAITNAQQKMVITQFNSKLAKMAKKLKTSEGVFDLSKMDALDQARWATLGMGKEDLEPLLQHMDAFALYDGNKLTDLQFSKWEPQLVSKYKLFLNRATNKIIQENDIGALSKWMHNPLAQMFLQFRTFTLGAWSNALLWQFNHMRLYARYPHLIMTNPSLFVGVMAETFFSIIAQLIHDASYLTTEEGRERFMNNLKDPAYLLKSGFARTSAASILPTLYDTIAPIIPFAHLKPQFSNVRSSGSSMSALWGSSTVDLINSASTIFKTTADGATSDKGFTQSQIKAIFRLLPWGNSLPLIAGINGLIEDHPHH